MLFGVTPSLHTPLMSVTNAISSVIIVGAIIAGLSGNSTSVFNTSSIFGFLAIALAAINIFGGFLVTQRMLAMYKKRKRIKMISANFSAIFYLVSGVLFILALRGLSSPETSRQGNFFGILGMIIAVNFNFFIYWKFFKWIHLCINIHFSWRFNWSFYCQQNSNDCNARISCWIS